MTGGQDGEERLEYGSKLELILTLVGYAVGVGNVWRFPYLAFSCGGASFMIPYVCALLLLGIPMFTLELGLGQMYRQGTFGVWEKMGLPRLRGVGAAATITTFLVSLYYNVILAWTIYYLGRTFGTLFSGDVLPWSDEKEGFICPQSLVFPHSSIANATDLIDGTTGLFNQAYSSLFWCPEVGIPNLGHTAAAGYVSMYVQPASCPARAAVEFWEKEALQQSSGLDDLGGMHWGMLLAYTGAWIFVYFCIFKGVASSGKVVYVTATLPFVALFVFFFRAVTLPNAMTGIRFFVIPDMERLLDFKVWIRAVTQIFYSLGCGFGSLIAFASYGNKHSDFAKDAAMVSFINCGTSVFAGFVVFPILGFLAQELSEINPCIQHNNLADLESVGLSGTGLAFIAFPIAVSQMPGGYVWAILFFIMLLCLGIDSQFAMVESVMTVLCDAGIGKGIPRELFAAMICASSYVIGLIFITKGGIYWFQLFDYYTCVVSMFFVTALECAALMWSRSSVWLGFAERVEEWTGRRLGPGYKWSWKLVCPALLGVLVILAFQSWDLMGAEQSVPYPEGTGYYPGWSIWFGWSLAILPLVGFVFFAVKPIGTKGGASDSLKANAASSTVIGSSMKEEVQWHQAADKDAPPHSAAEIADVVVDPKDIQCKVGDAEKGWDKFERQATPEPAHDVALAAKSSGDSPKDGDKAPGGGMLCCIITMGAFK